MSSTEHVFIVFPYFWVRGTDGDDTEEAFLDHPGVQNIHYVDSVEDQYPLRVERRLEYDGVLSTLMETKVPLIEAVGTTEQRGYFNSPRDVTMAELGDELGISQQAVASRLRRGSSSTLSSTLVDFSPPD